MDARKGALFGRYRYLVGRLVYKHDTVIQPKPLDEFVIPENFQENILLLITLLYEINHRFS